MISCRKIIGTAVIEIEHGVGLGNIHQVVVGDGVLLSYVVKSEHPNQAPYAMLSGSDIRGIGNFAAMVKSSQVLHPISEEDLYALTANQGAILDELVVTVDGNKIGIAVDYQIDDQNEIGNLIVKSEDKAEELHIPKSSILMIGKEFIILKEESSTAYYSQGEESAVEPLVEPSVEVPLAAAAVHNPEEDQQVETASLEAVESLFVTPAEESTESFTEETAPSESVFVEPAVETPVAEFDRDAILAQFDAAALLAKKHSEAEETPAEPTVDVVPTEASTSADLGDFVASATDLVVETENEQLEEEAPTVSSLDNILIDEAAVSGSGPVIEAIKPQSLEEAFGLSAEESMASDNNVVEETVSESRPDARVVQMNFSPEEGSNFLAEQKRLLVGKRLQKDLIGPDGNPILFAEEIVTDATIDLLRRIDRRLLVRLAGCVV